MLSVVSKIGQHEVWPKLAHPNLDPSLLGLFTCNHNLPELTFLDHPFARALNLWASHLRPLPFGPPSPLRTTTLLGSHLSGPPPFWFVARTLLAPHSSWANFLGPHPSDPHLLKPPNWTNAFCLGLEKEKRTSWMPVSGRMSASGRTSESERVWTTRPGCNVGAHCNVRELISSVPPARSG